MATSLLAQVRNIAKKAAKSGTGWHIQKDGALACKDKRCTLGAILFKHYEPARKIQEEFNALIERANDVAKGNINLNFSVGDEVFNDYNPDKFPDPSEVAQVLDMDDDLTALVVQANDHTRKELEREVQNERENAESDKEYGYISSINERDEYVEAQRALKARIILEEELLGKSR